MARGRPRLSPRLMPMLTTTVLAMLDMVLDTTAMLDTPMPPTAFTTERGRLRPSLRLMPTLATMAMLVLDTTAMLDTPMLPMDTTTARGRLRLSPNLMFTEPTDTDTP